MERTKEVKNIIKAQFPQYPVLASTGTNSMKGHVLVTVGKPNYRVAEQDREAIMDFCLENSSFKTTEGRRLNEICVDIWTK